MKFYHKKTKIFTNKKNIKIKILCRLILISKQFGKKEGNTMIHFSCPFQPYEPTTVKLETPQ